MSLREDPCLSSRSVAHLERWHALTRPLIIAVLDHVLRVVWRHVRVGDMSEIEALLPVSSLFRQFVVVPTASIRSCSLGGVGRARKGRQGEEAVFYATSKPGSRRERLGNVCDSRNQLLSRTVLTCDWEHKSEPQPGVHSTSEAWETGEMAGYSLDHFEGLNTLSGLESRQSHLELGLFCLRQRKHLPSFRYDAVQQSRWDPVIHCLHQGCAPGFSGSGQDAKGVVASECMLEVWATRTIRVFKAQVFQRGFFGNMNRNN